MKTGISTACFFCKLMNEDALKKIGELGVREAEVFFSANMEYEKPFTDELNRICDGEGIAIRSVHALCTPFEPQLFSAHPRQVQEAADTFDRVTDAAARLRAEIYVFHGAMDVKRARKLNIDFVRTGKIVGDLARRAKKKSVKLAYENVHWCWYSQPGFAKKLTAQPGTEDLYFTLDIKQAVQSGYPIGDYIDDMGGRLAHVHLCDYIADEKKGIVPALPFSGQTDWRDLKERLQNAGFDGTAMLEVYPSDYSSYDELAEVYRKTKDFFESAN